MQSKQSSPLSLPETEARFAMISRWVSPAERKILTAVWTATLDTLLQYVVGPDPSLATAAIGEIKNRRKAGALGSENSRIDATLAECLAPKTNVTVRTSAALALGERNDRRAIPILRSLLTLPEKNKLHEEAAPLRAAFLLARFQDTVSYPEIRKLDAQMDGSTKRHFADLLGMMGDPKSVSILRNLLKNSFMGTRAHAAVALGRLRDRASVDLLIALLSDQYADVRRDAAWALAAVGDKKAIPALKKACENPAETIDFKNTRLQLMATALSSQEKENSLHHSRETSRDQVMIRRALVILKNGNAVEIARDWRGNAH